MSCSVFFLLTFSTCTLDEVDVWLLDVVTSARFQALIPHLKPLSLDPVMTT
jgi:hypothetical protein